MKWIRWIGFGIPFVLVYKAFFLPGSLAWGDAPFFDQENLKELFNLPFLWNFRNDNFGSPQYHILWLYLPTYIYGILNYAFGVGNDLLIRIIFYFPASILALVGSWKFIGKFNQNIWGKFLGSFLYGFNTYFLMLIDGGQVGVALAYGLFPLTAVSILSFLKSLNIRHYLLALVVLFALVSADIRIALIAIVFTLVIWRIWDRGEIRERLKGLAILGLSVLGLCSYWIVPTLGSLGSLGRLGEHGGGTNFIDLSNSLFLFQPHFPLNQFGRIVPTPFYFVLLLPLILGSLILISKAGNFFKKRNILGFSLLFLLFVFLAKGGSEPLGELYSWFVRLPGGLAFRDSSKFYIPLMLVGSLLLSFTVSTVEKVWTKKIFISLVLVIYSYLLILIFPALSGNLSGVLGGSGKVGEMLKNEKGFFRTLWFEEKPALFYGSWNKPALSANNLYKDRPFASMIAAKYDLLNYIHSPQFCQWLDLLGVKYLLFPQNERKKIIESEEKEYWRKNLSVVSNTGCLTTANLNASFPAFTNSQGKPLIFGQKKAVLVVGGEEIYDRLIQIKDFSLGKQGFIFAEDGRVDLQKLDKVDPKSLVIVFLDKNIQDLQMGYLKEWMVPSEDTKKQQWKVWSSGDYLGWKYELLKQNISSKEFDFGKGVATSTVRGEVIKYEVPVKSPGNYILAIRYTNSLGGGIKVRISGQEFLLQNTAPQSFRWELMGPMVIDGEKVEVELENNGDFGVLNTFALIPENQFKAAKQKALGITQKYKTIFDLGDIGGENIIPLSYQQINPTEYQLNKLPKGPMWIMFSDHYDPGWELREKVEGVNFPFYAMVNGFYVDNSGQGTLIFTPQIEMKKAVILSVLSLIIIAGTVTTIFLKERFLKK